jgi:hypothetical protein
MTGVYFWGRQFRKQSTFSGILRYVRRRDARNVGNVGGNVEIGWSEPTVSWLVCTWWRYKYKERRPSAPASATTTTV